MVHSLQSLNLWTYKKEPILGERKVKKGDSSPFIEKYQLTEKEITRALSFTDFYLYTKDILGNSILFYPNKDTPTKILSKNKKLMSYFIKKIKETYEKYDRKDDFVVFFEDRSFRVCAIKNSMQGTIFALRQTNIEYSDFFKLDLGKRVEEELMHERLNKGGIVIIAGSPGNGKTTTSSALVVSRLEEYGGVCITVEDPPEYPLMGSHGKGICIQTEVAEGNFDKAIKVSMRSYPTGQRSIMFVGEIRDSETAVEAIKASIDGRLVIVTLHASSAFNAIKRIANLAHSAIGDEAYHMLGESFRVAVHQSLSVKGFGGNFSMNTEILVNNTACVNHIKSNKIDLLRNQVDFQSKRFESGRSVEYHGEDD